MNGFSIGLPFSGLFWIWLWLGMLAYAGPEPITPGETARARLEPGASHLYRVNLDGSGFWRVWAEQINIDIGLIFKDSQGKILSAVDSPQDEWGREWLTVETETAGVFEIEIQGGQTLSVAGNYTLRIDRIDSSNSKRLQAELAVTRAGERYFQGGAQNRREAIPDLEQATGLWRELGEKPRLARDIYCLAVLHRLLGESEPALTRAEEALALWRELGEGRFEGYTLNEIGLLRLRNDQFEPAAERFREAMTVRRKAGHGLGEAISHNNWCITQQALGQTEAAIPCFERVLEQFHAEQAPTREAAARVTLGRLYDRKTSFQLAEKHYQRALALFEAGRDRRGVAMLSNNLGALKSRLGDYEAARDHYHKALEVFRELGDRRWEARTLNNLGNGFLRTGMPERALVFLERALPIRREQKDMRGEIITLFNLSDAHELSGEPARSEPFLLQALELAKSDKHQLYEARALVRLAWNLEQRGAFAEALVKIDRAMELLEELSYPLEQSLAKLKRGYILTEAGRSEQAVTELTNSLNWFEEKGLAVRQAAAHQGLARIHFKQGHSTLAERHAQAAVALMEAKRMSMSAGELRDSFMGQKQGPYELLIDIFMQRNGEDPTAIWQDRAMELRELVRARGFAELIYRAGVNIEKGVDPRLLQQWQTTRGKAHALADQCEKLAAKPGESEKNQVCNLQLEEALQSLDQIEAKILRESPDYAALGQPASIQAREIQNLADQDTTLLIYTLGEYQSHLWQVTPKAIRAFELPGRSQIEKAALLALNSLKVHDPGRSSRKVLEELSQLLLGSAATGLTGKRLVVVPDGVLHYLPFDVLLNPSERQAGPICRRFEIVHLASISALLFQRKKGLQPTNELTLAVFADPVFQANDPRVDPTGLTSQEEGRAVETEIRTRGDLTRLPATRREAEAILELVPEQERFASLDFQAGKSLLLQQDLSRFRLLHFATHGFINSIHPKLSGIALSMVDPSGEPIDGHLRLMDIFNLKLNAELVVLSGCQTALGRNIAGEGMVGVTRGFMYAGARGVVASLWPVPDRATAELMRRFYQSLLRDGQGPAAALRSAKLSLARERAWRDPYFWGAFVFQGDWQARMAKHP